MKGRAKRSDVCLPEVLLKQVHIPQYVVYEKQSIGSNLMHLNCGTGQMLSLPSWQLEKSPLHLTAQSLSRI